jgi:DNA-binding transcriptional LysR family regulator
MVTHPTEFPSLSTDQVAAFVELARHGSLRAAAEVLCITEQGLRNRLIALEKRLGVSLYRKARGMRRTTPLTSDGVRFLPHAVVFLERASGLCRLFDDVPPIRAVNVVASQYLISYVLIDVVRRFHAARPDLRVRLVARTEREIEQVLREDPDTWIGVAAPYESAAELEYVHLFSMDFSLIVPRRHPLTGGKRPVRLTALTAEPLILYEQGSTGRQHVMEAFRHEDLSPRVEMEATNTDVIVRMVEAGLGVSIVPLLPSGIVTRGRRVAIRRLAARVRPIDSGILTRRGEPLPEACRTFVDFIRESKVGG